MNKNTRKNTRKNNKKGLRKTRSRKQRGGYGYFGYGSKTQCAYIKDLNDSLHGDDAVTETDRIYQEKAIMHFINNKAIMHFINNVVPEYNDHPRQTILKNLSNLYVLMADSRDKDWEYIMTYTDYNTLQKHRKMIVAYMLLTKTAEEKEYQKLKDMQNGKYKKSKYDNDENVIFIDWIDTIAKGANLTSQIINEYESQHKDVMVLPEEIIYDAVGFWADWIENKYGRYSNISEETDLYDLYSGRNSITDEDGILKKNNIKNLIKALKVNPDSLRWSSLFSVAGVDDNYIMPNSNTIKQRLRHLTTPYKDTGDNKDDENEDEELWNMINRPKGLTINQLKKIHKNTGDDEDSDENDS